MQQQRALLEKSLLDDVFDADDEQQQKDDGKAAEVEQDVGSSADDVLAVSIAVPQMGSADFRRDPNERATGTTQPTVVRRLSFYLLLVGVFVMASKHRTKS